MFKILYRTLIILFAAALIALGFSWFSGTSAGHSLFASGGGRERAFIQTSQTTTGRSAAPTFRADFGGDREGGVNITRALADLPGKVGVIAAITIAVVMVRKLLSLLTLRLRKRGPGAAIPA